MTITTLDALVAGYQIPDIVDKNGITMGAVSAGRLHSHWYSTGFPASGATPSKGLNGGAETSPVTGQFSVYTPSTSTYDMYLARVELTSNVAATFIIADRLWTNSTLMLATTSVQNITAVALPARDANGSTLGVGVQAGLEFSATGGAGTPTVTLVYTKPDGTNATAQFTGVASPPVGSFWVWPTNPGVRAPVSFQLSATWTSGNAHIVLFRPLAYVAVATANVAQTLDAVALGMPKMYSGTVPFLLQVPTATTATRVSGRVVTSNG